MEHTEGKLKIIDGNKHGDYYIGNNDDYVAIVVIRLPPNAKETKANAERLCLCWNTHVDLVAALEELVSYIEANDWEAEFADPMPNALQALKQAKGE